MAAAVFGNDRNCDSYLCSPGRDAGSLLLWNSGCTECHEALKSNFNHSFPMLCPSLRTDFENIFPLPFFSCTKARQLVLLAFPEVRRFCNVECRFFDPYIFKNIFLLVF